MEYVPKHTTENHFFMVLMVKRCFLMFVMVFVVETIRIFCDGSIVFSAGWWSWISGGAVYE